MKHKYILATLFLMVSSFNISAEPNQCKLARDDGYSSVNKYYNPRIKQVSDAISEIVSAGGDPSAIAIKVGDKFYTLPEIDAKLRKEKNIGLSTVNKAVDDCVDGVKPYQDIVNGFVDIATGGLAKFLPGKMGFVDASDILAGYPLGGKDALIPKARKDILNLIGAGGENNDLGKVIKNPVKEAERAVRCIFGC